MAEEKKTPTKFEKAVADVKDRLAKIVAKRTERAELVKFVKETTPELQTQLAELQKKQKRLNDDIALVEAQIKEAEPESFEQIAKADAEITRLHDQVKALIHGLPVTDLTKPQEITAAGLIVTVSKAPAHKEYNAKAMLEKHPEWLDLEIEGDALFDRSLNSGVLERLIAQGVIEEDAIKPFTTTVKDKAPSVSIKDADASEK